MTIYCFVCPNCGHWVETPFRTPAPGCASDNHPGVELEMRRDYAAEGVGLGSGVKVSRDGLVSDQARAFLPTNDEFKGPKDPDGTKGMRDWRERHAPRDTNTKPHWPGSVEKRTY